MLTFSFSQNSIDGSIPTTLGDLVLLNEINLFSNFLTGTIPTQLGLLSNLESLFLHFNELTGSMPAEICALRQVGLEQLTADCGPRGRIECEQPSCCTACF